MRRTVLLVAGVGSLSGFLGSLLAWGLFVPSLGHAQATSIRAGDFTFVGSDNTPRVTMEETTFGGANVRLLQDGVSRINLVVANRDPASSALNLNDPAGHRRIWVALKQGRTAGATGELTGIALLDEQERIRLQLALEADGSPFLTFLDADGNVTWSAP